MTKEIKQKKQDLGIFYTDQRIANFIFDILKIWKEKEEKESGRWESRKYFPSVIDPAVGEGVFLKAALEQKFTTPKYVFGVDIDEDVKKKWVEINLLKSFGSKAELDNHFYHQNGLLPLDESKVFRHKKGGLKEFDAVVGNPPYGGIGIDFGGKLTPENAKLLESLEKFEIFSYRKLRNRKEENQNYQNALFFSEYIKSKAYIEKRELIKLAHSFPIEILFLERFIQLAKPGGWIAIIIPDGILTNSNSHYVREFISKKTRVEAIVSLPRNAFKNVNTSAKTSILFLRKYNDQEKRQEDYPVFLASVDSLDEKNFNFIKDTYQKYYNKTMSNKNLVQTTTDEKGREIAMVRVDKTLKEMMEEKPASRWDTNYWQPKYEKLLDVMGSNYPVEVLDKFIFQGTRGITYGQVGKREYVKHNGISYIRVGNIIFTGVDLVTDYKEIKKEGWNDPVRSRINEENILIVSSGATIGKIAISPKFSEYGQIVQDVDKVALNNLNHYYFVVFYKSVFGQIQIDRFRTGTGVEHLDFEDIKSIQIPVLDDKIQRNIKSEYKKMSKPNRNCQKKKPKRKE